MNQNPWDQVYIRAIRMERISTGSKLTVQLPCPLLKEQLPMFMFEYYRDWKVLNFMGD